MLDPKLLRTNIDSVATALQKRGFNLDVQQFINLEDKRKNIQVKMQELQNERNLRSKEFGIAKAAGNNNPELISQLKQLSDNLKNLEEEFGQIQAQMDEYLSFIPNIPHESVVSGKN